jgi:hypothetical protein
MSYTITVAGICNLTIIDTHQQKMMIIYRLYMSERFFFYIRQSISKSINTFFLEKIISTGNIKKSRRNKMNHISASWESFNRIKLKWNLKFVRSGEIDTSSKFKCLHVLHHSKSKHERLFVICWLCVVYYVYTVLLFGFYLVFVFLINISFEIN